MLAVLTAQEKNIVSSVGAFEMYERSTNEAETVSFGERLASSQVFTDLFRDGMALVEETASYLDGPGRKDSKGLERNAALSSASRTKIHT